MQQDVVDGHFFKGFGFSQSLGNTEASQCVQWYRQEERLREVCIGPVYRMVNGRSLVI